MKTPERKSGLISRARALPEQAASAVEDIKTAAASVRTSTDTVALLLAALGVVTCLTLVLVVRMNGKIPK